MDKLKFFPILLISLLLFSFFGCQEEEVLISEVDTSQPSLLKVGRTMVWADCILYNSIVTPAKFKPESEPFDQLYAAGEGISFKDGIGLISESKPGDQDYNGGRWHLNVLKEDVDSDKYMNACSAEDLDPNDFVSTDMYFECPLLPRKNR